MVYRPTVAVDFDATLHAYTSGWTGVTPLDPPNDGALDFILNLIDRDYNVVIYTSRAANVGGVEAIKQWLDTHGFPPLPITDKKPMAIAYIDDRGVSFRNNNWAECLSEIERLRNK